MQYYRTGRNYHVHGSTGIVSYSKASADIANHSVARSDIERTGRVMCDVEESRTVQGHGAGTRAVVGAYLQPAARAQQNRGAVSKAELFGGAGPCGIYMRDRNSWHSRTLRCRTPEQRTAQNHNNSSGDLQQMTSPCTALLHFQTTRLHALQRGLDINVGSLGKTLHGTVESLHELPARGIRAQPLPDALRLLGAALPGQVAGEHVPGVSVWLEGLGGFHVHARWTLGPYYTPIL